jgi:hypothetical protein
MEMFPASQDLNITDSWSTSLKNWMLSGGKSARPESAASTQPHKCVGAGQFVKTCFISLVTLLTCRQVLVEPVLYRHIRLTCKDNSLSITKIADSVRHAEGRGSTVHHWIRSLECSELCSRHSGVTEARWKLIDSLTYLLRNSWALHSLSLPQEVAVEPALFVTSLEATADSLRSVDIPIRCCADEFGRVQRCRRLENLTLRMLGSGDMNAIERWDLPNLRSLTWTWWSVPRATNDLRFLQESSFPRLTSLSIQPYSDGVAVAQEFVAYMQQHPSLKVLKLYSVPGGVDHLDLILPAITAPTLDLSSLCYNWTFYPIPHFPPSVQILKIATTARLSSFLPLFDYLLKARTRLQEIHVGNISWTTVPDYVPLLSHERRQCLFDRFLAHISEYVPRLLERGISVYDSDGRIFPY